MKNIFSLLSALLLSHFSATCTPINTDHHVAYQIRAAETCADSSLAVVYVEAFLPGESAHAIQPRFVFVDLDSIINNGFQLQGEIFKAWDTPQDFTFPLYQLLNPTINDYLYVVSTNGDAPTVDGYITGEIVGYVYSTQVCGSVPLLAAFNDAVGDHWYTTDSTEQSSLIELGWTDAGIVGYVLPLN